MIAEVFGLTVIFAHPEIATIDQLHGPVGDFLEAMDRRGIELKDTAKVEIHGFAGAVLKFDFIGRLVLPAGLRREGPADALKFEIDGRLRLADLRKAWKETE